MIFASLNFIIACYLDDISIVDITWGLMFIVPNAIIIYHRTKCEDELPTKVYITFALVVVWALRLAFFIGKRHKGEDYRYKIIKKRWAKCPPIGRLMSTYVYIFALQAAFSMVNNASALHIM